MPKPDTSTASRRTAVGIEDSIRFAADETLVLIAPDGRELARATGTPEQVGLSQAQWAMARDCTCTHNHPRGTSFSLQDALVAAPHGVREIRVVTGTYRHIISRLSPGLIFPLHAWFGAEEQAAIKATKEDIRLGLVSKNDFAIEARHRTWLRLDNRLALNYWREQT